MVLWLAGASLVAMWLVFRDPAIDHRVVVLGAILPLVVDGLIGRPAVLHTLLGSVALLALVMAVTVGRRAARRRWLGLPIGTFLFLVAGGIWADRDLFWWPVDGLSFADQPLPVFDRPIGIIVALEFAGAVALVWAWQRFGLDDAERRGRFVRSGRIDRALTDPTQEPPTC
ncbi:MAG: hypothetical protein AAGA99_10890 [Actinomycetota bacterium]